MHALDVPPETAERQARVAYLEGRLLPFEQAKRQRERTELREP
jgi:hypothetical protein